MVHGDTPITLEAHRAAFSRRRFLAMPLAGLLCWAVIGIGSLFLNPFQATMLLFCATGSIVYLAMGLSRIIGEPFFRKDRNPFDRLFFAGLAMALLVYAIAIPFFLVEPRSITLTVAILAGLMWIPFSWIIQHWIGYAHAVIRTVLVLAAWYLFPAWHFQVISAVVVLIYIGSIIVLERRWRMSNAA